jgi:serine protease Do
MRLPIEIRIILVSLLFLIPITGGLLTYVVAQVVEEKSLSSEVDGFVTPERIGDQVLMAQESLVTIECQGQLGSGFSFALDSFDEEKGFRFVDENLLDGESIILTNAHVLRSCAETGQVDVVLSDKKSYLATIVRIDNDNDLAIISLEAIVEPFVAAYTTPFPGYWVMALGSPHSFAGSVTFGNVINADDKFVYSTASLSPGNSGGPLIDNEGFVFGINSGSKPIGQNFNISISVNVLCEKILMCPTKRFNLE